MRPISQLGVNFLRALADYVNLRMMRAPRPFPWSTTAARALLATILAVAALAQPVPPNDPILMRVSEEAEIFQRVAPKVIGRETLKHKGRAGAQRVKWFATDKARPDAKYREAVIVSEYGFGYFKEAPTALREFRQVISVDGRERVAAKSRDARQVLAENMASDDDRLRRRLLEDFEKQGQIGSATDFGQMVLLFTRRSLPLYAFDRRRNQMLGAEECAVLHWKQGAKADALTVYSGKKLERIPMEGELWTRKRDHLPVRITMQVTAPEENIPVLYRAEIDYRPSQYGAVLPVSVHFEKSAVGLQLIDNRSTYDHFQMFSSESQIVFEPEETAASSTP